MATRTVTIAVFQEETGWSLPAKFVEKIRAAAGDGTEVQSVRSLGALLSVLPDTHGLIGFPLTPEQFENLGREVRWIQLTESVGGPADALLRAVQRGVNIATAEPFRAPQTAEHAVALTLALSRAIDDAVHAQEEHRWAADELAPAIATLRGMTVGVIAMGPTGVEIQKRLNGFGVRTVRTDNAPADPTEDHPEPVHAIEDARTVAAAADVLIVAAPTTPRTAALIDRKAFRAMKENAVLVDVSRGGVVEHEALLDALRRQRIAAAALDGFRTRPLPPTSPLWTMPNVIITPGVAAASHRYWRHATETIAENLRRLDAGDDFLAPLDPAWFVPQTAAKP